MRSRDRRRRTPRSTAVVLEPCCAPRWPKTRSAGPRIAAGIKGVTEETTTGVHRLYEMLRAGSLLFPAINVNDSVTKSKFDNKYGCRHSLIDGINRGTDVLIGGKVAVVCGYGDVGKGCAESLRGQGARVIVTEIDPICALQAAMDGYQVATLDDVVGQRRHLRHRHRLLRRDHRRPHGGDEAPGHRRQHRPLRQRDRHGRPRPTPGIERRNVKPQVDEWVFPTATRSSCCREGRLLNLGNATGHPSFVMSNSFTNQVLAQIELFTRPTSTRSGVYTLPKHLDEKVARLHLDALGVRLTELTKDQAEYLGVDVAGPVQARPLPLLSHRPAPSCRASRSGAAAGTVRLPARSSCAGPPGWYPGAPATVARALAAGRCCARPAGGLADALVAMLGVPAAGRVAAPSWSGVRVRPVPGRPAGGRPARPVAGVGRLAPAGHPTAGQRPPGSTWACALPGRDLGWGSLGGVAALLGRWPRRR